VTTHPAFGRISPFVWLLLQAAAIVGSILLAFSIDAWWGERKEVIEKNALLESVRSELQWNRKRLEADRVYRQGAMDSAMKLLAAIESGGYEDATTTLDHRLANLTWFSNEAISTAAVDSLLDGGLIAAVESERLRHYLVGWPRQAEALRKLQEQDYETLMDEVAPFLGRNASLLQISNDAYVHGRPGDNAGKDPQRVLPLSRVRDHSDLLRNPEFAGLLVRKMWNDGDALFYMDQYLTGMDENMALIDQELAGQL
jgi:hypothetical protein